MPERARRLHRASAELLTSLDLDQVQREVVSALRDILAADAAAVMLLDGDGDGTVSIRAHEGLSDEYVRRQRLPIDRMRAAYRTPDEHLIVDLRHAPLGDPALIAREGLARALVIPLTKDGQIIGVLNAYLKDPEARFLDESIDLAHVLAAEAGVAIANAQLYKEALDGRDFQRALVESLGTAVFVARPPAIVAGLNRAAVELTGLDPLPGAHVRTLLPSLGARLLTTGEILTHSPLEMGLAGREWSGEVVFAHRLTGEERVADVIVHPVRDREGRVIAAVATLHDLTELRRVEEEKEQFLSIVSHELRTPLTPLKALAQLLITRMRRSRERGTALDLDSFERNLASIERQVDRMNGLVSDLLSVSRAGRGQLEMDRRPFDLATSVRDIVERYVEVTREEGRHRFAVEAPSTFVVTADQARVEQLLMNLIGNAVKYSPRGGDVHVSLERRDGMAQITIADEGIGISGEDLPRLGTAAFTRGTGKAATFAGMGIGLHVAKLLADAHGGSLELESAGEDRGTTVRVKLPA